MSTCIESPRDWFIRPLKTPLERLKHFSAALFKAARFVAVGNLVHVELNEATAMVREILEPQLLLSHDR